MGPLASSWAFLGPSWDVFGRSWGVPRPFWGRFWLPWGSFGRSSGCVGVAGGPKNRCKTQYFTVFFDLGGLRCFLWCLCLFRGRVWRFGGCPGPSWGCLGPFWGCLGAFLGPLGDVLGRLGAVLGPSWAVWGVQKSQKDKGVFSFLICRYFVMSMLPRRPKTAPRRPQDGLKTAPRRPKTPQDCPKTAPRRPRDGRKMAQDVQGK